MSGRSLSKMALWVGLGVSVFEAHSQNEHRVRPETELTDSPRAQSCRFEVAYDEFLRIPDLYGAGAERRWTHNGAPDGRPLLRLPLESASRELLTESNRSRFKFKGAITPGMHWIGPPYRLTGDHVEGFAPVSWIKTGVVRDRLKDRNSKEYLELQKMVRETVAGEEKLKAYVNSQAELQAIADEALEYYRSDLRDVDSQTGFARMYRLMQGDRPNSERKPLSKYLHDGLGTSQAEAQIAARIAEITMTRVIMQGLSEVPASCLDPKASPQWAQKNKELLTDLVLQRFRACVLSNSLINQKGVEFCMNQELPKISEYLGDLLTQILLRETLDTSVPPDYLTPAERVEALEKARQAFRKCHRDNAPSLANEMSLHVSFCVSMSVYPAVRHMVVQALDKKLEPYVPNDPATSPTNRRRRERIQSVLESLQECPALIQSQLKTDRSAGGDEYGSFLTQYFSMTQRGGEWVKRDPSMNPSQIIPRATAQIKAELTACIGEIVRGAGEIGVESEMGRNEAILAHLKTFAGPEARSTERDRILKLAIEGAYRPCMDAKRGGEVLPNPEDCKDFVTAKVGADVIQSRLPAELMQRVVELFPRNSMDPRMVEVARSGSSLGRPLTAAEKELLDIVKGADQGFRECVSRRRQDLSQKHVVDCMGGVLKSFMPRSAEAMLKHHPDYKIAVNASLRSVLANTVERCVDERLRDVSELSSLQEATTLVATVCTAAVKREALVPVALLKAEPIIRGVSSDPDNTRLMMERYRQHILEPERRTMLANVGRDGDPKATDEELERAKESILWNSYRFVGLNAALDLFRSDDPQYVDSLRELMTREEAFGSVRPNPLLMLNSVPARDIDSLLRNRIAAERQQVAPVRAQSPTDLAHQQALNRFHARGQINELLEKILNDHMSPSKRSYLIYGSETAQTKPLFPPTLSGEISNPVDLEARLKVLEINLSRDVAYEKLKLTAQDLFPGFEFRPGPLGRPLTQDESLRFAGSRNPQEILDSLMDQFLACKERSAESDCNTVLARGAATRFFQVVASDTLDDVLDVPSANRSGVSYFAPRLKPGVNPLSARLSDYEFHPWDRRSGLALYARLSTQQPAPTADELVRVVSDRTHAMGLRRSLEQGVLKNTTARIQRSSAQELPELLTDAEIQIVERIGLSTITHTLHGQLALSGDENNESQRAAVQEFLQGDPRNPGPSVRFQECLKKEVKSDLKRPRSEISASTDLCIRYYALGFPRDGGGLHPGFAELAGLKVADSLLAHLEASDRAELRKKFRNSLLEQLQDIKDPPRSPGFKDRITAVLQGALLNLALEIGLAKSKYDLADQVQKLPVIRGTEALHQLIDSLANGRRHKSGLVVTGVAGASPSVVEFDNRVRAFGARIQELSQLRSPPPSVDELRQLLAQEEFFRDAVRGSIAKSLLDNLTSELIVTDQEATDQSRRTGVSVSPTDKATQARIRMAVTQIVRPETLDARLVGDKGDIVAMVQSRMRASGTYEPEKDPELKTLLVQSLFRPSPIAHRKPDDPELPEELLLRALVRSQFNDTANEKMGIVPGQTRGRASETLWGIGYWWEEASAGNRTEVNSVLRTSPSGQRAMDLFRRYVVYATTGLEADRPPEIRIGTTSDSGLRAQREMAALTRELKSLLEKGSEELTWGNSMLNSTRNPTELFEYRKKEREKVEAAEEQRRRFRESRGGRGIPGVDDRFRGPKY